MSSLDKVRVGNACIDLEDVSAMYRVPGKMYVYLYGGRFLMFQGDTARLLWERYCDGADDMTVGVQVVEKVAPAKPKRMSKEEMWAAINSRESEQHVTG